MSRRFSCGDRVRLTKDCSWEAREGGRWTVARGAQGVAGEMYMESGFIFVHFDRVVGDPCLLVKEDDLELIPRGEPRTLHYVQQVDVTTKSCNLHSDCAAADEAVRECSDRAAALHCSDPECMRGDCAKVNGRREP